MAAKVVVVESTHASCGLDYCSCNIYKHQPNRDHCGTCCTEGSAKIEVYPSSAFGNSKILDYYQNVLVEVSFSFAATKSVGLMSPAQSYL